MEQSPLIYRLLVRKIFVLIFLSLALTTGVSQHSPVIEFCPTVEVTGRLQFGL